MRVSASRRTCVGPFGLVDLRDLGERHGPAAGGLDEELAERLGRRRARRHEEAELEAAMALVDRADVHADARGLDGRERVLGRDAVAGEANAVGPHDDGGRAEDALDAHVARAAHAAHERADLLADPLQLGELVAEDRRSARRRASR